MRVKLIETDHGAALRAYRVELDGKLLGYVGMVYSGWVQGGHWRHYLPISNSGTSHSTRAQAIRALRECHRLGIT